jgi:hypothetical protein
MKELYLPLTYKFEYEEEAKELISFLEYSKVTAATSELDTSSGFFIVSVCKEQFDIASKLAKIFHTEKTNHHIDSDTDDLESNVAPKGSLYTNSEEAYKDLSSTASAFLVIGILGIIINFLSYFKVISLPIMNTTLSFITMNGLFILFIGIGFSSYKSAKTTKEKALLENDMIQELTNWFFENYDEHKIDNLLTSEEKNPEELYFSRAQTIRSSILKKQEVLDEALLDSLVEDFYSNLYEK